MIYIFCRTDACMFATNFNIAANLTLNTMASFVILLIARTARIHEVILGDKILQCMVFKHSMLYYVIGKHVIQ